MTRVKGVSDADASWVTRGVYAGAKRRVGQVPEPLRIMAHNGAVMWAAGGFELAFACAKSLPKRLKDLAALKVAARVGCVF